MEDLNDKVTGGSLSAAEWNQVPSEIQNVIEGLGQVLAGGDLDQLGKGIAGYAVNGQFYTDSGAADAHVLSVIGLKQAPTAYTDGFRAVFRAAATNTGATTVNAATLGVKNIFYNGAALTGGEIVSGDLISLIYDNANGRFDLASKIQSLESLPGGGALDLQTVTATTSGTSHDYTSIPSWVKRITVTLGGVSVSGTSTPIIQLGDSGGIETSGYNGVSSNITTTGVGSSSNSSGFKLNSGGAAASVYHGTVILSLHDSTNNIWTISGSLGLSDSIVTLICSGSKSLSAILTQIRLTTVGGTDTFDAGSFNVIYE